MMLTTKMKMSIIEQKINSLRNFQCTKFNQVSKTSYPKKMTSNISSKKKITKIGPISSIKKGNETEKKAKNIEENLSNVADELLNH